MCALADTDDPEMVLEYWIDKEDTKEQLIVAQERRQDRVETLERKKAGYNVQHAAVRDFAEAGRQAFDDQAPVVTVILITIPAAAATT